MSGTIRDRMIRDMQEMRPSAGRIREDKHTDWHGTCQKCGHVIIGTLAKLQEPCEKCGYGPGI